VGSGSTTSNLINKAIYAQFREGESLFAKKKRGREKARIIYHQFVDFNLLAKASNDERKLYTIKDFQNDDIGKTKMKNR